MNVGLVEQALALAADGLSHRAIGERLGISHTQVGRLLRARVTAPAPVAPGADAGFLAALLASDAAPVTEREPARAGNCDDDAEPEPAALPGDTLARLREMQERYLARAERAEAAGDFTAASRAGRDAATLAPVIARLERDARATDGVYTFTEADWKREEAALDAMVKAVMHRPFLCASCGSEMRRLEAEAPADVDVYAELAAEVTRGRGEQ